MAEPLEDIKAVAGGLVALAIILLVVLTLTTQIVPTAFASETAGQNNVSVGILGGSQQFGAGVESVSRVRTSLNQSAQLTGADDSNVTVEASFDLGQDFSVCTFAEADASVVANNETRLLMATEEAILWYNGSDDAWHGYFYNVSSRNSYRATVTAASPTSPTLVCLNHGGTSLNVSANNTVGNDTTTTASNIADYPENVSNWHGAVEETRLYGSGPLNTSERTEWLADPVLAIEGRTPEARVTYDTFATSAPSAFETYFTSGDAAANNVTLGVGRRGPVVTEGTDYDLAGETVQVLSGGVLDENGEVLYIGYVGATLTGPFVGAYNAFLRIGPVALILAVLGILAFAAFAVVGWTDDW
jgi:hypothetical protein